MQAHAFACPELNEQGSRTIWEALKKAIGEVQEGNASKLRYEELYRNAYTLVLHKHGDMLYRNVEQCIVEKLEKTASIIAAASNDKVLEVLVEEWERHKLTSSSIRDILMYMDRAYCKVQRKTAVYPLAMYAFRDKCFRNDVINYRVKQLLQDMIEKERNGEAVDRALIKSYLGMLTEVNTPSLELYQKEFEADFLKNTRRYYATETAEFLAIASANMVPEYLLKADARFKQEELRANACFDPSTKARLLEVLQDEMIVKVAQRIVLDKTGCPVMFEQNDLRNLARFYHLFSRQPATFGVLCECMQNIIKDAGHAIVTDPENLKDPFQFVRKVLDLRAKYNTFVEKSFRNDPVFVKCLKDAIEAFINSDGRGAGGQYSRAAQFLSLYIDDMLRKALKGMSDSEAESLMNQVLAIFRYLQDKDIFEDFYKQHLAGRLLTGSTKNIDIEKRLISKLKAECGHQFTSRLEGMMKDMETSKILTNGYNLKQKRQGADMNVSVLTTGFWPVVNTSQCVLPPVAESATKEYNKYYLDKHVGRRLTWQTNLGTAELVCQFDNGKKELLVSTYQMCILMLYNKRSSLTYKEIESMTKIPEGELQRHLLSLAHPKVRVLKKTPNQKALNPTDTFEYNNSYESNLFRIMIQLLSTKVSEGTPNVEASLPAAVLEARKNRVEASIVRVMKSRKALEHNSLITEVSRQITGKFAVDPIFIKKCIEVLIEKDYMERDKDDRSVYHYCA